MALTRTTNHETVSIYPFTDEETEALMAHSNECVLMWSTKDGWPVGVTHAFVWHEGRIWLTFTAQRHRAAAIRRDNRVSVNVSSAGYPEGSPEDLPSGAITFKGRGELFDDEETKHWMYRALAAKGKDLKGVRIYDAVPKELLPAKKMFEEICATWRKDEPLTKTKVICQGGEIKILVKGEHEKKALLHLEYSRNPTKQK